MTLDDKRRVIEALLIASDDNVALVTAAEHVDADIWQIADVVHPSYNRWPAGTMSVSERYANVAYRMIGSSATLRREWFGAT